jgi:cytochrome P450
MHHPSSDIDLFADDALRDPYPRYRALRDAGSATYLKQHDVWFVGRYTAVRDALSDWKTFTSAQGIGLNPVINQAWAKALICMDPPEHTAMRKLITDRLGPMQVRVVEETIDRRAKELVERLVAAGNFDAVTDLANDLPVNVIMDLIGWPQDVRAQILEMAEGGFDPCGPANGRMQASLPKLGEMMALIERVYDAGTLTPGGFGSTISDAARRGEIPREVAIGMLAGYVVAAFDTTISAVASGVWLFAENPAQWQLLRSDVGLVPRACSEILRMECPIQHFSRVATRDVEYSDGSRIPAGGRAIVSYAAANRDERQFANPDRFDITRRGTDILTFGLGNHACAGQSLAKLEMHAIFRALAANVEKIELNGLPDRTLYNVTRGLAQLPVRATGTH